MNAKRTAVPARDRDRQMLDVLALFRIIFKSVHKHYEDVERRAGVSGAQLWALALIAATPGCQVGEIAQRLAVHQSTASNLLRRLENAGLVSRRRLGVDRRGVQLYASAKGLKILAKAPKPLIGVLQYGLSRLPRGELDLLHRHLERLTDAMKARAAKAGTTPLSEM